jgi:parallel beta-helix repeat protein
VDQSSWLRACCSSATVAVDGNAGGTIGATLGSLKAGDTIAVSRTCREHVIIPAEVSRITLDGQGKATIQGTGPAADTILVLGKNITIKGFTLTGGRDGIHLSGPAAVVIDGNIIQNNGRGIHLDKGSIGRIINNTIQNNRGVGINVIENSYARIGFFIPPEPALRPNTIRNNQGHGIHVGRASSAWIIGNTIADNTGTGIVVNRSSQADIAGNIINGNGGDARGVSHNSGVNLQSEGTSRREGPNHTDPARKNSGVAVRCSVGGYVDGPLGALAGSQGVKEFDNSCVDRVTLQ